jgi:hypothetical protein
VPGLNAPEEESRLFVSGFMSKGLCGPTEDMGRFVSSDKPVETTKKREI